MQTTAEPRMTRLEHIISTNCGIVTRRDVVPRIICKDGTVLSVQASQDHYARCTPGRWTSVEVSCLEESLAPKDWFANNEVTHQGWRQHDCTDWIVGNDLSFVVYMYIPVEEVRTFIDSHGGESENQPDWNDIGRPYFRENTPSGRVPPRVIAEGAEIVFDGKHFESRNRPID